MKELETIQGDVTLLADNIHLELKIYQDSKGNPFVVVSNGNDIRESLKNTVEKAILALLNRHDSVKGFKMDFLGCEIGSRYEMEFYKKE